MGILLFPIINLYKAIRLPWILHIILMQKYLKNIITTHDHFSMMIRKNPNLLEYLPNQINQIIVLCKCILTQIRLYCVDWLFNWLIFKIYKIWGKQYFPSVSDHRLYFGICNENRLFCAHGIIETVVSDWDSRNTEIQSFLQSFVLLEG